MTRRRQLMRYVPQLAAVVGLIGVAAIVGGYILSQQRLRFPWEDLYTIRADFRTGQALRPGQGHQVTVAGVKVGEIVRVELVDGVARVEMEIDREELPTVHDDARMLMRPRTGLKDMTIQLEPGDPDRPLLRADEVLPVERTQPDVNLDEVLAALDADTRAWLQATLAATGEGLRGRGPDLRALFRAGAPTARSTERVTRALTERRGALRRLVTNLRVLAGAAAEQDEDLGRLVRAGNTALSAVARQDDALAETVRRLPATLDEARGALAAARPFSRALVPAAQALRPALRDLRAVLPEADPLLRDATPALARIRGLVRDAKPVVADLRPALRDLRAVTPTLSSAFDVLTYVVNELAHNPKGAEEGYLFWLAWFSHNAASILSVEDAHGVAWRGQVALSCSTYAGLPDLAPLVSLLVGGSPACPPDPADPRRGGGGR